MEDGIRQSYKEEEQAGVLEEALTLSLADAVFMIVHYNHHNRTMGPGPHCDPIELSVLHDRHDPNEIAEWRLKALKLRENAYSVGDALLRKDGTYDRLRVELEAAHPSFSSAQGSDTRHHCKQRDRFVEATRWGLPRFLI